MFLWSVELICRVTCGRAFNTKNFVLDKSAFSIDTRTINQGDVFFAIKGPNFDGHEFVDIAFARGAALVIVEKPINIVQPFIIVDDVLHSMQRMAAHYISMHSGTVIAITGSVGKTTTKAVLQSILSIYGNTYASFGNFNNHIGLPLSVLRAPIDAHYLIFELGMSGPGEIQLLSTIVRPNVAVITNVAPAHLATFTSVADIAMAKSEIFSAVRPGGTAVLNLDNHFYDQLLSTAQINSSYIKRFISFGRNSAADVHLLKMQPLDERIDFSVIINLQQCSFTLNCRSQNIIFSILASLATLQALNLPINSKLLTPVIQKLQPLQGRGMVHRWEKNRKKLLVIDESYNANPESVHSAIETLSTYSCHRKILILGDMLELGNDSVKFHVGLLATILSGNIDVVLTTGHNMQHLHNALPQAIYARHFDSCVEIVAALDGLLLDGDVVLIKASAGVGLSNIVTHLNTA